MYSFEAPASCRQIRQIPDRLCSLRFSPLPSLRRLRRYRPSEQAVPRAWSCSERSIFLRPCPVACLADQRKALPSSLRSQISLLLRRLWVSVAQALCQAADQPQFFGGKPARRSPPTSERGRRNRGGLQIMCKSGVVLMQFPPRVQSPTRSSCDEL